MPDMTRHAPGTVSWIELASTDQAGARRFYSELFGWAADEIPMGPGETYSMMKLRGRDVGAIASLRADERAQGIPSHWRLYFATENVDADAKRAADLGAKVLAPPFDVFDSGRMTVLQDPSGAILSLWQAKQHVGLQVADEPGSYAWCELQTRDTAAATAFYTKLFGWKAGGASEYVHWSKDGADLGGMIAIQKEWGDVPPSWMIYVDVTDVDRAITDAKARGGNVVVPVNALQSGGRWAVLADPQGAVFGVYQKQR
jgi:uncharacterized protein